MQSQISDFKSQILGPSPLASHIVFAGGGTGGHLFPGLAVAAELRAMNPAARITFATGRKALEREHVSAVGFEQLPLPCQPLPRGPRGAWRFAAENLRGYRAARRFLRREEVSVVVGLGGYASVPMAWAAAAAGVPLVLLEQNAMPGRATRWLAPRAALICVAFSEARQHLKSSGPIRVTGTPIRPGFCRAPSPSQGEGRGEGGRNRHSASHDRQLLILGGSGGSHTLNEQVPRALHRVRDQFRGWRIIHQTGARKRQATKQLYLKLDIPAVVASFVDPLQAVLHRTDLAICRAGGSTLAELAAVGVPAILLPLPTAADDHQRRNADVLSTAGAARVVDERDIPGRLDDALAAALFDLLTDAAARQSIVREMRLLARPTAAWHVASMILDAARALFAGSPLKAATAGQPIASQAGEW